MKTITELLGAEIGRMYEVKLFKNEFGSFVKKDCLELYVVNKYKCVRKKRVGYDKRTF